MSQKIFVVDTNVFLHDPHAIYAFDEHDIVIPIVVLEEIDRKKDTPGEIGSNARQTCRILDQLRAKGSLGKGVEIREGGGTITVYSVDDFQGVLPDELNDEHPDNMIIAIAVGLRDKTGRDVCVVTKDINMRIKCNVLGVPCEDYKRFHVAQNIDEIFCGYKCIAIDDAIANDLKRTKRARLPDGIKLMPNEFLVDAERDLIARVDIDGSQLLSVNNTGSTWLEPRNIEQRMALKLLFDDRVKLVSLIGPAGTGKTLIAVAAALDMMIEQQRYDKLVISRPVQPVGRDLGYLPGDKNEKMLPWVQPIYDNIEFLLGKMNRKDSMFDMLIDKGRIEIEAITYMRGRSIANAFIIIDEAQNCSAHELKTIITRAGDGSKIVLTGDIQQIDNHYVDALSNGLSYCIEKFKSYGLAGHITLKRGERSELATLASMIL